MPRRPRGGGVLSSAWQSQGRFGSSPGRKSSEAESFAKAEPGWQRDDDWGADGDWELQPRLRTSPTQRPHSAGSGAPEHATSEILRQLSAGFGDHWSYIWKAASAALAAFALLAVISLLAIAWASQREDSSPDAVLWPETKHKPPDTQRLDLQHRASLTGDSWTDASTMQQAAHQQHLGALSQQQTRNGIAGGGMKIERQLPQVDDLHATTRMWRPQEEEGTQRSKYGHGIGEITQLQQEALELKDSHLADRSHLPPIRDASTYAAVQDQREYSRHADPATREAWSSSDHSTAVQQAGRGTPTPPVPVASSAGGRDTWQRTGRTSITNEVAHGSGQAQSSATGYNSPPPPSTLQLLRGRLQPPPETSSQQLGEGALSHTGAREEAGALQLPGEDLLGAVGTHRGQGRHHPPRRRRVRPPSTSRRPPEVFQGTGDPEDLQQAFGAGVVRQWSPPVLSQAMPLLSRQPPEQLQSPPVPSQPPPSPIPPPRAFVRHRGEVIHPPPVVSQLYDVLSQPPPAVSQQQPATGQQGAALDWRHPVLTNPPAPDSQLEQVQSTTAFAQSPPVSLTQPPPNSESPPELHISDLVSQPPPVVSQPLDLLSQPSLVQSPPPVLSQQTLAASQPPPGLTQPPPAVEGQPPPALSHPPPAMSQPPPAGVAQLPPAGVSQPPPALSQPPPAQSPPPALSQLASAAGQPPPATQASGVTLAEVLVQDHVQSNSSNHADAVQSNATRPVTGTLANAASPPPSSNASPSSSPSPQSLAELSPPPSLSQQPSPPTPSSAQARSYLSPPPTSQPAPPFTASSTAANAEPLTNHTHPCPPPPSTTPAPPGPAQTTSTQYPPPVPGLQPPPPVSTSMSAGDTQQAAAGGTISAPPPPSTGGTANASALGQTAEDHVPVREVLPRDTHSAATDAGGSVDLIGLQELGEAEDGEDLYEGAEGDLDGVEEGAEDAGEAGVVEEHPADAGGAHSEAQEPQKLLGFLGMGNSSSMQTSRRLRHWFDHDVGQQRLQKEA